MPGMEKQDEEHAVAFPTITSVPELICSNEPDETRFSATNSTLYSTDLQDHPVRRSSAQCYKKA